jgi:ABC-type iron transport system FetAB permease component
MSKDKELDSISLAKEIKELSVSKNDEPLEFINESIFSVNWKLKLLMFLVFMLISSTMFINNVISKFGTDTVRDTFSTTNKGTVIQGVLLVAIYSILATCVDNKII